MKLSFIPEKDFSIEKYFSNLGYAPYCHEKTGEYEVQVNDEVFILFNLCRRSNCPIDMLVKRNNVIIYDGISPISSHDMNLLMSYLCVFDNNLELQLSSSWICQN